MADRDFLARLMLAATTVVQGLARLTSHRWIGGALKLGVSAVLIVVVCRDIDLGSIGGRFAGQSRVWLVAAALITLAQIVLMTLRWEQILVALGAAVATYRVMLVTYIGSFFNSWLLGSTGGDVVRAVLMPSGALDRAAIIHSVLFDRVATLTGLGLVIMPLVVFDLGPFAHSPPLLASLAVVAVPFIGMVGLRWLAARLADRSDALSVRLRDLVENWNRLFRAPGHAAAAVVLAAIGQVAISATVWCLASAQHADMSFVDLLVLMPPVMLLVALPISAGGWGVREGAMVAALTATGLAPGAALLISIEMGLIAALVSLPGGVIWLLRYLGRPSPLAPAER
jgi:uncharacterized membrane protein YbhN (UPF0104 family)